MIKNISLFLCLALWSLSASSQLINRGGGLIYDDVLNITWMADAGIARNTIGENVDWWAAMQWANDLVYAGYDDWRLPNMDVNSDGTFIDCRSFGVTESDCRDNEYDYLFTQYGVTVSTPGLFSNIGTLHYWSGTENPVFPDLAAILNFDTGFRGTTSKITINRNAWAVRDGDVAAVPVPAAIWLLGSGLIGLTGLARKNRDF